MKSTDMAEPLQLDADIEPEETHEETPDSGPDPGDNTPVSTEVLAARLIDLRDDNITKLRELATFRRRPNPELVAQMRLDALLDLVLDDLGRVRFELIFETRIAEMLDGALREARQAELLDGTGIGAAIGQPMPPMPGGPQDSGPPPGGGLILPG